MLPVLPVLNPCRRVQGRPRTAACRDKAGRLSCSQSKLCRISCSPIPSPLHRNSRCCHTQGLLKAAVYRDEKGELHTHAATCTHLGCVVAWNPHEKTFDVSAPTFHIRPWPAQHLIGYNILLRTQYGSRVHNIKTRNLTTRKSACM